MHQNVALIQAVLSQRLFYGDAAQEVGAGDDDDDDGDDETSSRPNLSDPYEIYLPCDQLCAGGAGGDADYDVGDDVSFHLHVSTLPGFLSRLQNDQEILDLP